MELIPGTGALNDLVVKLFGPSCDYLGERLKAHISGETAKRNTARVVEKAIRKIGSDLTKPGAVRPRIMKAVLEEAPYCDNEVMAEYLGGVLASSRGAASDRTVAMTATLGRLSTCSIVLHFVLYRAFAELIAESPSNTGTYMLVDGYDLVDAVYCSEISESGSADTKDENEKDRVGTEYALDFWHAYNSLKREDLLKAWRTHADTLEEWDPKREGERAAVVFKPTSLGVDMFVAAHGRSVTLQELIEKDFPVEYYSGLPCIAGARWLNQHEREVFHYISSGMANTRQEAEWLIEFGQKEEAGTKRSRGTDNRS